MLAIFLNDGRTRHRAASHQNAFHVINLKQGLLDPCFFTSSGVIVKKMPQLSPISFLNSRGESLIRVTSGTTHDLVEVEYDDANAPLTMKLTTNDLTDNLSCPRCSNIDKERIHWKRLQLTSLSADVGVNPFVFPLEIISIETQLVFSANQGGTPAWRIDEESADEMIIKFQEHPPLVILKEVSIPVLFRSRFFKLQARLELQCQGCNVTWLAWKGVIAVYDPIIFRQSLNVSLELHSFSRTLEMMTIAPRVDEDPLTLDDDPTRTNPLLPPRIIGFYIDVTVSVPPDSIPTLAEPLPLHFLLNTSYNRSYARHFTIFNVTPSSWKPTPQEPRKTVRILIGLRQSRTKNEVSDFLQQLLEEGEQVFTLRIEGPIQQGLHPRVDVDVILEPSTLQVIINQLTRPLGFQESLREIAREIESYLREDVLKRKLRKISWEQLLPIHELLEVRKLLDEQRSGPAGSGRSDDRQREETFPFMKLLDFLDHHHPIGREDILPTPSSERSRAPHPSRYHKIIVNGLPGIGKTSCAVQLVRTLLSKVFQAFNDRDLNENTRFFPLYLELGRGDHRELLKSAMKRRNHWRRWFHVVISYLYLLETPSDLIENLKLLEQSLSEQQRNDHDVALPSLIWILDGWNESPSVFRQEILDYLEITNEPFILFTRPGSIPQKLSQLASVLHVEVQPLSISDDESKNAAFQLAWRVITDRYQQVLGHANLQDQANEWKARVLKELAKQVPKKMAETLGREVLIPFLLIPACSHITMQWIQQGMPRNVNDILQDYHGSKHELIEAIFDRLMSRYLNSTFLPHLISELLDDIQQRCNLTTLGILEENFHELNRILCKLMSRVLKDLASSVVFTLHMKNPTEKDTWFDGSSIESAFNRVPQFWMGKTEIISENDAWGTVTLKVTNQQAATHQSSAEILDLTISVIPRGCSRSITKNFLFKAKNCLLAVLFPRIHQRFITNQNRKLEVFDVLYHDEELESYQKTADTELQVSEEREILHELLADFFLAHDITKRLMHFTKKHEKSVFSRNVSKTLLTWMENEQFDEVWIQVFTSPPFNDDPRAITPFLEHLLETCLSSPPKSKIQVEAMRAIMDLLADLGMPFTYKVMGAIRDLLADLGILFAYNGHEWEVERSFRLRLSPRGIKHVQLAAAFRRIRDSKDRARVLEELVNNWQHLDSLTVLDLSRNELQSLPESFGQLKNLNALYLWGNFLEILPESFGQLHRLEKLYLHGNQLKSLPETFGNLSNLQTLEIYNNQLKSLPETFGQLSSLQHLELQRNELKSLPETFGQLSNLQHLELQRNELKSLPETFGQLSRLQTLDLHENQLQSLPDTFGNLSNLQKLKIYNNELKSLPDTFGQLSRLEHLSLSRNQLKSLPETFGQLSRLEYLDLGGNQLKSLPETFGNLSRLQTLYLWGNQLKSLPEPLLRLTNLQTLDLSGNQLKSLPDTFGQLHRLQTLYLDENQLQSLPETFGNLNRLQTLSLGRNQLKSLPETFGQLHRLEKLYLSWNQLKSLPETFGRLNRLEYLDLSGNQLKSLPETFGLLHRLQELDLSWNQLKSLPDTLIQIAGFKRLWLHGNPSLTLSSTLQQWIERLRDNGCNVYL